MSGKRLRVPGERRKIPREDELHHQVSDEAQGLIVGAGGDLPISDERHEWDDHLGGHAEYRSWCELCVAEVSCKDVQRRC